MKKVLTVAAVLLVVILVTQVALAFKFFGNSSDNVESVTTPDVKSAYLDDAQKEIEKLGLKVAISSEEFSKDVKENYIISQTPAAGTELKAGDTVNIVLSKGAQESDIPNVVGKTLQDAENTLKENKMELGNVSYEFSDFVNKGLVISQDPKSASDSSNQDSKVNVVVSKGTEVVKPPKQEQEPVVTPEPEQPKPEEAKPEEEKPDQSKPEKPDQSKPDQSKPEKPDQSKPEESKPDKPATNPDDSNSQPPATENVQP